MHLNFHPIRLAYQPPANSTFLSEQTSHQQSASSTFLSEQTSTSHQHQPNEHAVWLHSSTMGSMDIGGHVHAFFEVDVRVQ
jgi:hypothetical protein